MRQVLLGIFFALFLLVGVLSGLLGWRRYSTGDICVQCGARRITSATNAQFFWFSGPTTTGIATSPGALTPLWAKYCGGCNHDWTRYFQQLRSYPVGPGFNACGFPRFEYPALCDDTSSSNAIESLQSPLMCDAALRAIGSRDNLLRFVAAEALHEIDSLLPE